MSVASAADLLAALRGHRLLDEAQLAGLTPEVVAGCADGKALAQVVFRRGWMTRFQLAQAVHGRAAQLVVGHYVLLDKLGAGGMGQVYKALQQKLGRVVALKVMRPELLANPTTLRRFQREARAAAQLNHPNIATLYDADCAGGVHFLALEFVDGIDLGRLVADRGPLPVAQACDYARQAALGLHHAHERGLVHRDIKPANLLVDRKGVLKILDMGLARSAYDADDPALSGSLTHAGTVVGTPDFMAPEQAKDSARVDHRADLYALGATLYFLLTGRPLFPSGTAIEKLLAHQMDEPAPVESLRGDVPAALPAVLGRLLAKRPEGRFATAAEAAAALETLFAPGAVPYAVEVPGAAVAADDPDSSPFNFAAETPADATAASSAARSATAPAVAVPRWWPWAAGGAAAALALAVFAGVLAARRPPAPPAPAAPASDEWQGLAAKKASAAPAPAGPARQPIESFETYLPDAAGFVAVAEVPALVKPGPVADHLLPLAEPALAALRLGLDLDVRKDLERVVLALDRGDPDRFVVLLQFPFVRSSFTAHLGETPDEVVMSPQGRPWHLYKAKAEGRDRPVRVALLSPTTAVVAGHRGDALEALAKTEDRATQLHDPHLTEALARRDARAAVSVFAAGSQAGGRSGERPLADAGVDWLAGNAVLEGGGLEVDVTLHGPDRRRLRAAETAWRVALAGLVAADRDRRLGLLRLLLKGAAGEPSEEGRSLTVRSRVEPGPFDTVVRRLAGQRVRPEE